METEEVSNQQRALEMYEKGAQSESIGLMRDAIIHYSAALKIHSDVEKLYRNKLLEEYQQELENREMESQLEALSLQDEGENVLKLDPCWLLDILTDDILMEIATILVHTDPRAHVSFSACCQRLSQVCFSSVVYKQICLQVYPKQVYSSSAIQLNNITSKQEQMVKSWDYQWPAMLNDRPFIKYKGVYIAKITYISEGARAYSYYAPVKLVTYFRYMRFYPDGTVLKLTTTDEPSLVVPHFDKSNITQFKMALISRFTIELDGQVIMKRHTPDYEFVEELKITSLGDRKYHRLQWASSSTINKEGEVNYFNMRKEKPFNFSGVRSYQVD